MKTAYKIISVVLGGAMAASGIFCMANPALTFLALGWIVGLNMAADALGNILAWNARRKAGIADGWTLAAAIVSLVFGGVLLASDALQLGVDLFIAYMAAFWLVVIGILRIVHAVRVHALKKALGAQVLGRRWGLVLVSGIALTIVGLWSMMNPAVTMVAIGTIIGVNVLFAGVNLVITACEA